VTVDKRVQGQASRQKTSLVQYEIIYNLLDKVKELMIERIPAEYYADVKGEAEVLKLFNITISKKRIETCAGSRVGSGSITRGAMARLMRNDKEVWRGTLKTLKFIKRDINEAVKGSECGIALEGCQDVRIGDRIQSFVDVVKVQTL
jgi:translation initiation factor IF-2